MKQKRVAAVHDISCFGRCSLTAALPILSATGIETSVIPTAILSTHTGGFTGFTVRDLTDDILPVARHWKSLNLGFDAIYTGYLGSAEQIDIVTELFGMFRTWDNLIYVDPVMADNGVMYPAFDKAFAVGMARMCAKADVVIPNITEAVFMLGEEYAEGPYTRDYIEGLLRRLAGLGPRKVFLTGVYFNEKELGAAAYDRVSGEYSCAFSDRIEGYYHGTGDVFGSALLAALLGGKSDREAAQIAVDFTIGSLLRSKEEAHDVRFGVNFEYGLRRLADLLPPQGSTRAEP